MPFFPQRHKNKIVIIFLSALLCLLLSSLWLLKGREGFFNTLANDIANVDESNYDIDIADAYDSFSLDDTINAVNKKPGEYLSNMYPGPSANANADAALILDAMEIDNLKANALANGIAKEQGNAGLYPKGVKSIYIGEDRYGAAQADYDLNSIATDIINKNPYQQINWSTVQFDTTKNVQNTIGVINYPSHKVPIMMDSCSTLGILNSDFKTDICTTYAGDNITINEKCQELSATNCTLPSCCVLVNGICMAGNKNGPIFNTHNGMTIDYNYYKYKDKIYGKNACDGYTDDSRGISKNCMIQIWKDNGCTITTLFDDPIFVEQLQRMNKKKAEEAIIWYANNYKQHSMERCTGNASSIAGNNNDPTFNAQNSMNVDEKDKIYAKNACDGYTDDSKEISKECMIQIWKDNGCTNTTLFNDPVFVEQLQRMNKKKAEEAIIWYANNYKQYSMERCTGNAS
jgi:hypothetical protein